MVYFLGVLCYNIVVITKKEERSVYKETKLYGVSYAELNTEVRFNIADARSDGSELVRLLVCASSDAARAVNCLKRVLRAMKRSNKIEFFISESELYGGSTEAEFLLNKYNAFLPEQVDNGSSIFVKI